MVTKFYEIVFTVWLSAYLSQLQNHIDLKFGRSQNAFDFDIYYMTRIGLRSRNRRRDERISTVKHSHGRKLIMRYFIPLRYRLLYR